MGREEKDSAYRRYISALLALPSASRIPRPVPFVFRTPLFAQYTWFWKGL